MAARSKKPALLILDMLNLFDFPEAEQLLPAATKAAHHIARLKKKFIKRGHPVIYVNDHFGHWHADWKQLFAECSAEGAPGRGIALTLQPSDDDYFILKPKHSGFYLTALELLLAELKVRRLVITGIAGNLCVLFTAHDAHMREFDIVVPRDCCASNSKADNQFALRQIEKVLKLPTTISTRI